MGGKIALVTGGVRGIGREIALKLASGGANIAVNGLVAAEEAESTLAEIRALGVEAAYTAADISKAEEAQKLVEAVLERFGRLDILVNNAGITRDNLLIRMREDEWDSVIAVNLKGTFNCTQAAAKPMMKQRQGVIVNIASVVGVAGNAGQANYSASKGGVIALTKTVAKELASRNVRANAVAPGFIETAMTQKLSQEVRGGVIEKVPLGCFGDPKDVANAVAWLASDESAYITGQVLQIDGGLFM